MLLNALVSSRSATFTELKQPFELFNQLHGEIILILKTHSSYLYVKNDGRFSS